MIVFSFISGVICGYLIAKPDKAAAIVVRVRAWNTERLARRRAPTG
jgi:hypothetical protein